MDPQKHRLVIWMVDKWMIDRLLFEKTSDDRLKPASPLTLPEIA
jgi:hypothetical protein